MDVILVNDLLDTKLHTDASLFLANMLVGYEDKLTDMKLYLMNEHDVSLPVVLWDLG